MAIEDTYPPLSELTMSDAAPPRGVILYEAANLIGSTTINGALYGIAFALYILCVRSLYPQFKNADQQRRALFTFAYTSVVVICGLIFVALVTQITQLSYVVHRKFPGGPTAYEAEYLFTQPIGITVGAFSVVVDLLTLGVQVSLLASPKLSDHYLLISDYIDLASVGNLEHDTICHCRYDPTTFALSVFCW